MSKTATIMCVRTSDCDGIPFGASKTSDVELMAAAPRVWAGPRFVLETEPDFLQIIPYVLVKKGDEYLAYVRTTNGGEDRLHGKVSIGLGGHIDAPDFNFGEHGEVDFMRTVKEGARRELVEELNIYPLLSDFETLGWVRWDATEVDKVHLGVVLLLDLDKFPRYEGTNIHRLREEAEDALGELRFMSADALRKTDLETETWTRLALDLI